MMLGYHDIRELVKRVTYKPNVEFEAVPEPSTLSFEYGYDVKIRAKMWTLNSRQKYPPPGRWTHLVLNGVGVRDIVFPQEFDMFSMNHDELSLPRNLHVNMDPIPVSMVQIVPRYVREQGERQFWMWFRHAIIEAIEEHESREWFRIDGELVDDPHKPIGTQHE